MSKSCSIRNLIKNLPKETCKQGIFTQLEGRLHIYILFLVIKSVFVVPASVHFKWHFSLPAYSSSHDFVYYVTPLS